MRVSSQLLTLRLTTSLRDNTRALADVTQQISTGRRFERYSDEPIDANVFMRSSRDIGALTQYRRIAQGLNATLDTQSSAISQLADILDTARSIAIEQSGSSANAETRTASSVTVDALIQQAINLGNTRVGNEYIFGGTLTDQAPFASDGTYRGNTSSRQVEIGENITIDIGVDGQTLMNTDFGAPGNVNFLQMLRDLRDALAANDIPNIAGATEEIEPLFTHVQSRIADIGSRGRTLEAQLGSIQAMTQLFEDRVNSVASVRVEEASVELTQRQTAMQSALMATSRLLNLNLISFLR